MHKNRERLIQFTSSMKGVGGRENKVSGGGGGGPAPSADLLVCFPSRAHLALMPKPISSPKQPNAEPNKRHQLKKINTRSGRAGGGPASPLVWAKGKQGGPEVSEPTSPKVTCAGQIKVRPRISSGGNSGSSSSNCRNWQSVMEEIERIHNIRSKHTKKSKHWAEALGFKKDVMNFLTCLGNIRFDFRCFGSFPDPVDVTSDDEDDEEEEEVDDENNTVFSKWYMVLQENQNMNNINDDDSVANNNIPEVPPANALLLMRCRSAPAKRGSWLQERENVISKREAEEKEEEEEEEREKEEKKESEEALLEEEEEEEEEEKKEKKRESLAIVMKYDTDFYKLSSDVSQETWLVGGLQDAFSRSRSWKR